MYRPFYPEVTCSATQLERTKVENNAQIEAPRGGEILYSAPLSVSMLVDGWQYYVSVWLAQCLVTVGTMLGDGWDNVGTLEPLAKSLVIWLAVINTSVCGQRSN